jgi:aspartate/methionine/tyrosine aminotransferase
MIKLAARMRETITFHAVEVFKDALALRNQGHDVISLSVGEPDFTAAPLVVEAANRATRAGLGGYTAPAGLWALREAIAKFYGTHLGANINPARVIVTNGASGALTLAAMAVVNPGDEVLMGDPCYPPNRNFISSAGGTTRLIPTSADNRFQLSAADIDANWGSQTKGALIASPSNPTGTSLTVEALSALIQAVNGRDGFVMMDEIYLALSFDSTARSALTLDDNLIVLNSFSKYFAMTGWRLGWMIVPEQLVDPIEKLAASLVICAPTLSQHAALACFEPESLALYESRRLELKRRRDFLVPALKKIGIDVPVMPDGAFYVYADISQHSSDSMSFAKHLLANAHIACVPGVDFGPTHAASMVRIAYTNSMEKLEEAVHRLSKYLA